MGNLLVFFRRVLTSFPSSPKPLQAVSGVQVDACKINQFLILLKSADQKEGKIQLSRCSVNIVHLLSALVHPLCTVRCKEGHPELPTYSFQHNTERQVRFKKSEFSLSFAIFGGIPLIFKWNHVDLHSLSHLSSSVMPAGHDVSGLYLEAGCHNLAKTKVPCVGIVEVKGSVH